MQAAFLSDIELYYSPKTDDKKIFIEGEELHHIKNVMRHKLGDKIYITDGEGHIYKTEITVFSPKDITCRILERKEYPNPLSNITFCIPRLKSAERFEFALEKSVELGITNFIIFDSQRAVAKGEKMKRWQKILTSAMKQSLRAWLPKVSYCKSIPELMRLDGKKIIFDQNTETLFTEFISSEPYTLHSSLYVLIFGPEGGFSEEELKIANGELKTKLTDNRLRSETAIVAAATQIALNLTL